LYNVDVPFDNNFGERSIRGAVIMRKNSYNNRSQRGLNPITTVKKALKTYTKTNNLPTLAELTASDG
jgi:transposase